MKRLPSILLALSLLLFASDADAQLTDQQATRDLSGVLKTLRTAVRKELPRARRVFEETLAGYERQLGAGTPHPVAARELFDGLVLLTTNHRNALAAVETALLEAEEILALTGNTNGWHPKSFAREPGGGLGDFSDEIESEVERSLQKVRRKLLRTARRVEKRHWIGLGVRLRPLRRRYTYTSHGSYFDTAPTLDVIVASSDVLTYRDGFVCAMGGSFSSDLELEMMTSVSNPVLGSGEAWSECASRLTEGWGVVAIRAGVSTAFPTQTVEPISIR